MIADSSSRDHYARGMVRSEFEPLFAALDDFRQGFIDDLHAMERRLILTMVGTMLGGVLTMALIGMTIVALSE